MADSLITPSVPVFHYSGVPSGRGFEAWREGLCRDFCRIDVDPGGADDVHWRVELPRVSSLSLARVRGTAGSFRRTRDLLSDANDDLVLTTAAAGEVVVLQQDRPIVLRQSEMCLMDMSIEGGVRTNGGNRFTSVRIPRRDLLSVCPHAERKLYEPLTENAQIRDLIVRYFDLTIETAAALDAVGQQTVARHVIDLIALLLRTSRDETHLAIQRGYSAARLQLIEARVLANLSDPNLNIASVAQSFGFGPKQVQRLFEKAGTTFTEYVLEHRLLMARSLLSSPSNRQEKIGSIAYGLGFGDLSYFNRCFRKRFGMTPSEWRDSQPN